MWLKVDRNIQASRIQFPCPLNATQIATSTPARLASSIVRMNFSVSLPSIFKRLIYEFALLPESPAGLLQLAREHAVDEHHVLAAPVELQSRKEVATCQVG